MGEKKHHEFQYEDMPHSHKVHNHTKFLTWRNLQLYIAR